MVPSLLPLGTSSLYLQVGLESHAVFRFWLIGIEKAITMVLDWHERAKCVLPVGR